jgi:hypothetical protein
MMPPRAYVATLPPLGTADVLVCSAAVPTIIHKYSYKEMAGRFAKILCKLQR